jgi:dihydrofolate reductase
VKLTTITVVTADGVMQGLGGSAEDPRGGFERGGWVAAVFDQESGGYLQKVYERADAFLLGRVTYDIFAAHWGAMPDSTDPVAVALNSRPKYVASTTLTEAGWAGTTVLSGDVAAAVRELKAGRDGELQVHGSGALVRWLLDNGLVDELILFVCPVILGQGTRLFPAAGPDIALDLLESQAAPKGVVIQVYRTAGRPQYAPAG